MAVGNTTNTPALSPVAGRPGQGPGNPTAADWETNARIGATVARWLTRQHKTDRDLARALCRSLAATRNMLTGWGVWMTTDILRAARLLDMAPDALIQATDNEPYYPSVNAQFSTIIRAEMTVQHVTTDELATLLEVPPARAARLVGGGWGWGLPDALTVADRLGMDMLDIIPRLVPRPVAA